MKSAIMAFVIFSTVYWCLYQFVTDGQTITMEYKGLASLLYCSMLIPVIGITVDNTKNQ